MHSDAPTTCITAAWHSPCSSATNPRLGCSQPQLSSLPPAPNQRLLGCTRHRSYSQKADERERYWRAKLDEAQLKAEQQAAAAEQRWAAGAAEAEARWRAKVDELRHAWGAEQAALEAEWSEKMEQSHTRWLQVGCMLGTVGCMLGTVL